MFEPVREDSVETPYGWVVLAASLIFATVSFGTAYSIVVSLKPIAAEFGWPRWVPSMAYTLLALGSGVGGIFMSLWADKRGVWEPAVLGALAVGAGMIVASTSQDKWFLLATCVLMGLFGASTATAPMLTNATRWFDRRRGVAVSIVATGQPLAGAIWPQIFNHGIETVGWRQSWMWFGVVAIVLMLAMAWLLRRPAPVEPLGGGAARTKGGSTAFRFGVPPNLVLAALSLAIVGCCVAMAMPMVHLVAYCSDLGFPAARGAEMLSLLLACSAVSRLAFGFLSDRIGGLWTILLGSSMQAASLGLFTAVDSLAGLYAVAAFFGLVFGGIVPAYALAVRELFASREAGWRMGVVFLFGTVGMGSGGLLGGWIFDLTGAYHYAFLAGIAFNVVNLMSLASLIWLKGPSAPRPAYA